MTDFNKLNQLVADGYLVKSELDNLVLYNYTQKTTFDSHWIPETLNARGTIYNKVSGKVEAYAFPKFFNVNQHQSTELRNLPKEKFIAFEKMDGSLGTLFRHGGVFRVATRGSFYSDQAVEANKMLGKYELGSIPRETNLLFEIIYPENKIIVNYGKKRELVLLGAYDRITGEEVPWQGVVELAKLCGFPVPKVYDATIDELIKMAEMLPPDNEGWVLRFTPSNFRVKIKGAEYLKMAKFLYYMSPIAVWEAMYEERVGERLKDAPDEFLGELTGVLRKLTKQYRILSRKLEKCAKKLKLSKIDTSDKEAVKKVAMKINKHAPPVRGYLFGVMRGKNMRNYIYDLIRPDANQYRDVKKIL